MSCRFRCQFGSISGLAGGSRCFHRVPRALLVIMGWSTAKNEPSGPISDHLKKATLESQGDSSPPFLGLKQITGAGSVRRAYSGQQGSGDQELDQSLVDFGVNLDLCWASLAALVILIMFLVPCLS